MILTNGLIGQNLLLVLTGNLPKKIEMIFYHRADDGITAGQRVIGKEQNQLAVIGNLDLLRRYAFARLFVAILAFHRHFVSKTDTDAGRLRRDLPELAG